MFKIRKQNNWGENGKKTWKNQMKEKKRGC